jgi:hypothetical protein
MASASIVTAEVAVVSVLPVEADPLGGALVAEIDGDAVKELFEFLAQSGVARRDLSPGDPLEEAAPRFSGTARRVVDPTEQIVRK